MTRPRSKPPPPILFEDEALLAVDKPAGRLTVAAPDRRDRCVLDDLRAAGHNVAPVHRLDRETSGVLLLSRDAETRAALQEAFRRRRVGKQYLALVHGVPTSPRATIDVPILDEGATARIDRRGARAVTHYEVLERFGREASLLRLTIDTGRHNQIRLHLAHLRHPVIGDRKYGLRRTSIKARRTMLHAARLELRHPVDGRALRIEAPPPADFTELLTRLRDGEGRATRRDGRAGGDRRGQSRDRRTT